MEESLRLSGGGGWGVPPFAQDRWGAWLVYDERRTAIRKAPLDRYEKINLIPVRLIYA